MGKTMNSHPAKLKLLFITIQIFYSVCLFVGFNRKLFSPNVYTSKFNVFCTYCMEKIALNKHCAALVTLCVNKKTSENLK